MKVVVRARWSRCVDPALLIGYARRLLVTGGVVGLSYFTWRLGDVLLLIFAAAFLSVLLSGAGALLSKWTSLTHRWALAIATLIILVFIIGFLAVFGAQLTGQVTEVILSLPTAIDKAGLRFGIENAANQLQAAINSSSQYVALRAAGLGYTVLGAVSGAVLVFVASVYIAADPLTYLRGLVKPLSARTAGARRRRIGANGEGLTAVVWGQLVSMLFVGTLTTFAVWAIGLPSPLAMGLMAGLTNFVPFVGPIVGSIPALLFASTIDAAAVLWTVVAVVGIQQVEGNIITPLVQQRAVDMPPAVALFAIVICGAVFGLLGTLLAVPLAVSAIVLIKKIWMVEALGETTTIPGEEKNAQANPV